MFRWFTIGCLLAGAVGVVQGADLDPATVSGPVSIQLPHGWTALPPGGPAVLTAAAPQADSDTTGKFQASLSINQVANKIDGAALQQFLAKQIPGYRVVEQPTPATVNGIQGVFVGGTFKSGNVELRTRQYMFSVNNQVFTITFTSLNSLWANYRPLVEASVGTFSIKKPA